MTAEQLIRLLLEFDQQVISPRPSSWGEAAELVADLCRHAEVTSVYWPIEPMRLGDWRSVDLSAVRRRAPVELDQPVLDKIMEETETK